VAVGPGLRRTVSPDRLSTPIVIGGTTNRTAARSVDSWVKNTFEPGAAGGGEQHRSALPPVVLNQISSGTATRSLKHVAPPLERHGIEVSEPAVTLQMSSGGGIAKFREHTWPEPILSEIRGFRRMNSLRHIEPPQPKLVLPEGFKLNRMPSGSSTGIPRKSLWTYRMSGMAGEINSRGWRLAPMSVRSELRTFDKQKLRHVQPPERKLMLPEGFKLKRIGTDSKMQQQQQQQQKMPAKESPITASPRMQRTTRSPVVGRQRGL